MNNIIAIFTIALLTGVGYIIIRGFGLLSKKDNLLAIACSYGLGIGLVTMQMYVYARLHIPWQKPLLFVPWLILAAILFLKNKDTIGFRMPKIPRFQIFETILLFGILFAFCYTTFQALIRPVSVWDAWVTWLLKSKVFFLDGTINPDVLSYIRVNYPLVINLLGTIVYVMIGMVDDVAVLLTSTAFYAFTALLLFSVLKKRHGLRYALLFTFLQVTTQNFVRHGGRWEAGLADLPLGYYSFCSVILLLQYMKDNSNKVLILLNIFLGITGLIKHEGIPMGIVIGLFAVYHIYKYKLYKHLPILLFWIMPIIDWDIFQRTYNPKDTYFSSHIFEMSIQKTVNAFWGTFKELINIKSWNLLWILYFYSFILFFKKIKKETFILHVVIISQLSLYMAMYLFTVGNNPESSIERLLIHIAPVALYYISLVAYPILDSSFAIITSNGTKKYK